MSSNMTNGSGVRRSDAHPRTDVSPIVEPLRPLILKSQPDLDRGVIPEDLVDALWESGVFRALLPAELGGLELHPVDWLDLTYELARIDGSVGWLACIHSGGGDLREPEVMEELLAESRWLPAGSIGMNAKARRVDGGYKVTGRWNFSTGLPYATHITCLSRVVDHDDNPVIDPDTGAQMIVNGIFPIAEAKRHIPDWLGMRGTGSGAFELKDAFVPDRFVENRYGMPEGYAAHAVHRVFWTMMGHASNAVGIAQGAIDAYIELAHNTKRSSPFGREQLDFVVLGRADALVRGAQAFAWKATDDAFEDAFENDPISYDLEIRKTQANVFAGRTATEALRMIYDQAGTDSVRPGSRLERCFRDLSVVAQHGAVIERTFGDVGEFLITHDDPNGPRVAYVEGLKVELAAPGQ